jgi:hypothetical protein
VAFAGAPPVIGRIHALADEVVRLAERDIATGDDARGRQTALEELYQRILREKGALIADTGYGPAELHAVVSPSLEDLQFLSNAVVQGRIIAVERRTPASGLRGP